MKMQKLAARAARIAKTARRVLPQAVVLNRKSSFSLLQVVVGGTACCHCCHGCCINC